MAALVRSSLCRRGFALRTAFLATPKVSITPSSVRLCNSAADKNWDWEKHRAYDRPKTSDDPKVLLAGRVFTDHEWEAWYKFEKVMTWRQWFKARQLLVLMNVCNSFVHGGIRRGLTIMAVYAAGSELLHDFFHHYHTIHYLLSILGTNHAVGFIALSHLSEHFKEYLEELDKP